MKKVLMIGLDGATFSLLNPLMEDGVMPALKRIISEGVHGDLMSTENPLTPPAWISMYTGRSPRVHGVHDFVRPESKGDQIFIKINDSRDIRCETIWSLASRQGKQVTTLNFYGMSPISPINGHIISGFVPWKHLRRATYPPTLFDRVKTLPNFNYKNLGMDITEEKKCVQGLLEGESRNWIESHIERNQAWGDVLRYLMEGEPSDLTAIVFDGPDKIQHLFWRYLDPDLVSQDPSPEDREIRELCLKHFRELDAIIDRLVELAGPETNVIMTSDHGFGATTEIVYINEWLAQNGYLQWSETAEIDTTGKLTADRMKEHLRIIDWKNTIAYCPTPSSNSIFVKKANSSNTNGVPAEEYVAFCKKLKQQLLDYRNPADGGQVFVEVNWEQSSSGKLPGDNEPDITLKLRDGGLVSILKSTEIVKPRPLPEGAHRANGIFIAKGPDVEQGKKIAPLSILDITPLLLYFMELPMPTDLEGRVPQEILKAETLMKSPVQHQGTTKSLNGDVNGDREEISEGEKEALMEQLKVLGYME